MKRKKQKSSLFVGRWQPFHEGHKALVKTVLKKEKPIVIAIRDTEIDYKNPYTTYERWSMIQNMLEEYGDLVKIVVIPDIDEICYGRNVGYAIRKIDLDLEIEKVSGTKIRNKHFRTYPIIWLTGQTGSGKTTLAKALKQEIGGIILDGDEMRKSISRGLGFSKEDREENNLRVARLAKVLSRENIVIVSVIAPFRSTRKKINRIAKPIWIYIEKNVEITKEKSYEPPKNYHIKVNTNKQTTKQQVEIVLKYLKSKKFLKETNLKSRLTQF